MWVCWDEISGVYNVGISCQSAVKVADKIKDYQISGPLKEVDRKGKKLINKTLSIDNNASQKSSKRVGILCAQYLSKLWTGEVMLP